MRSLPRPATSAADTYHLCLGGLRDASNRQRLTGLAEQVSAAADWFGTAAQTGTLHLLAPDGFAPAVKHDREILKKLYEQQMARQGRPGRVVYDQLMTAARKCPLCGVGRVTTVDHHLPKSVYLYLSVAPDNLVPACRDCNTTKGNRRPKRASEQTLHPYFDDIAGDTWLAGQVREQTPPIVEFCVVDPPGCSPELAARVRHHFQTFDLGNLYTVNAAELLSGIAGELERLLVEAGTDTVRAHLARQADSWSATNRNCWEAATYRALAENVWYCGGGFGDLSTPVPAEAEAS
ncbi:HNH endonuclease [Actinomadura sp. NPDC000600]|uniref:HNH endonuclease n=1 Tax=Actinomadura sp. NPDC000600 TaxID=3154262 RepID=UPI00339573F9